MRPVFVAACAHVAGCTAGALIIGRWPVSGLAAVIVLAGVGAIWLCLQSRPAPRIHVVLALYFVAGIALAGAGSRVRESACAARIPDGAEVILTGWSESLPGTNGQVPFKINRAVIGGRAVRCGGVVRVRLPTRGQFDGGTGARVAGRWWSVLQSSPWPIPPERRGVLVAEAVDAYGLTGSSSDSRAAGARVRAAPVSALRGRVQGLVRALFRERSGVVEALILARKDRLPDGMRDRFVQAGLAHLLAISGTHVALIAGVLMMLAGTLRMGRRARGWAAAAGTMLYVAFIGAPHAALRAAVQITLIISARLTQRPADPFALLGAAAIMVTVADPLAPLGAGFQLSFGGILGILIARRPLFGLLPPRWSRWLRDGLATGVAATLATAPIAALHFGQFAPIGIVATLVAMPLLALAIPAIAMALVCGAVVPDLGAFLADGCGLVLDLLVLVADRAAALPGGHTYVTSSAVVTAVVAAAVALLAIASLRPADDAVARRPDLATGSTRTSRIPPARAAVATGAAILVFLIAPLVTAAFTVGALEIHAIDVGQGDAIAVRSPRGRWILVDTGPRTDGFDAGRSRVLPFLSDHGARAIEAIILTHPHADHVGGAAAVMDAVDVDMVIDPAVPVGESVYMDALASARRAGASWRVARAGRELRFDGVTIEFLAPDSAALDDLTDPNDYSVVFRLAFGAFSALFFGDAPAAVEDAIIERYQGDIAGQLIKVGHHGSRTSTGDSLLRSVRPRLALISAGSRNRYGHPHPDVLERLARYGVGILRTDEHGDIRVRVRPNGHIDLAVQR